MRDGWYKVEFGAALPGAGGVVKIRAGQITGADDQYVYDGTYDVPAGEVHASISVAAHAPSARSVFNTAGGAFILNLQGHATDAGFTLHGKSPVGGPDIYVTGHRIETIKLGMI